MSVKPTAAFTIPIKQNLIKVLDWINL